MAPLVGWRWRYCLTNRQSGATEEKLNISTDPLVLNVVESSDVCQVIFGLPGKRTASVSSTDIVYLMIAALCPCLHSKFEYYVRFCFLELAFWAWVICKPLVHTLG